MLVKFNVIWIIAKYVYPMGQYVRNVNQGTSWNMTVGHVISLTSNIAVW